MIERAQKILEQYPENPLARFSLGKAYFDAADFVHAKEQLEKALSQNPEWMVVQILIGKCELALGNRVAAKENFEKARQLAIAQKHEGPQAEMEELLKDFV